MTGTAVENRAPPAAIPLDRPAAGWVLLYDGRCRLCRRSVGVLRRLDWLRRLNPVSYRDLDLPRFNAAYGSSLSAGDVDRQMYLLRPGGPTLGGYDAYRRMALLLPALWPVAPFLWFPGVSHLGRAVYRWVAARRLRLFGQCDESCGLPGSAQAPARPDGASDPADGADQT